MASAWFHLHLFSASTTGSRGRSMTSRSVCTSCSCCSVSLAGRVGFESRARSIGPLRGILAKIGAFGYESFMRAWEVLVHARHQLSNTSNAAPVADPRPKSEPCTPAFGRGCDSAPPADLRSTYPVFHQDAAEIAPHGVWTAPRSRGEAESCRASSYPRLDQRRDHAR